MSRYTTVTMPRREFNKLKEFKEKLANHPVYSFVRYLGLGAFVGFVVDLARIETNMPVKPDVP